MIKRTIFFGNPYHISTSKAQLLFSNKENGEKHQAPVEDLGFVILENPQITITQGAITELANHNVAVIFCNDKRHPSSMLFHLDTHYIQNERFRHQVNASEPLKKQLWQQTIKAKLENQALLLEKTGMNAAPVRRWKKEVLSGDSTNREALASKHYWKELFGNYFNRERFGDIPNNLLNYGYAILRAAVARSICGSGLLPTLGIHHRNKYNAYCLADDMMEPFRPFVDETVYWMHHEDPAIFNMNTEHKQKLINLMAHDTISNKQLSPMMIAISNTTAGLAKCYEGKAKRLTFPKLPLA